MNDCNNLSVLPSYVNQTWLNAVLISVLYSEYSRNLLLNEIDRFKQSDYIEIIKQILISYYVNKQIADTLFKSIEPAKLIFKILNKMKSKLVEHHIVNFYKYLGIKVIGLGYYNKQLLTKEFVVEQPDVIVFFHEELNNYARSYHEYWESKKKDNNLRIDGSTFKDLLTYSDVIEYNNIKYKLTSCLVSEYQEGFENHSIAGIYCNGVKHVYNGYKTDKENTCSLIKYDWDLKKDEIFCLNPNECNISLNDDKKISDLCFNFGTKNKNKTLVYVREDKTTGLDATYKREEIATMEKEIKSSNINDEIMRIKDLSIIGLLKIIEDSEKKPMELSKLCKTSINRNKLERFVLKNILENLKTGDVSKSINKTEDFKLLGSLKTDDKTSSIKKPEEPVKPTEIEPVKPAEIEQVKTTEESDKPTEEKKIFAGGKKKITKEEMLKTIKRNLTKIKKEKLLKLYEKLVSISRQ